jgi:hypothetical protein
MKIIMMTVFAMGMAGCLAAEPGPAGAADQPATAGAPEAQLPQDDVDRAMQHEITSDDLARASAEPGVAAAQDCAFIDWCDQPNSANGTVCIVRSTSACQAQCVNGISSAIINECIGDGKAVCGTIIQKAQIFCSRSQE